MNVRKLYGISGDRAHLISVDSSLRDHLQWPTPAEYCVKFDRPIQNVIGYDILDATLPNNTYMLDAHNNRLGFGVWLGGTQPETTTQEYIEMLAGVGSFERVMNDPNPSVSDIKVVGDNDVFTNAVKSSTSDSYLVYFKTAAISKFNGPVASGTPAPVLEKIEVRPTGAGSYEWRRVSQSAWSPLPSVIVGGAPRVLITLSKNSVYDVDPADLVAVPLSEKVVGGSSAITGYTCIEVSSAHYASQGAFYHEWQLHNFDIETGDHDIDSLVTALSFDMPLVTFQGQTLARPAIAIMGTSQIAPQNFTRRRKMAFRCMSYFWFDMNRSSSFEILGFNEMTCNNRRSEYSKISFGCRMFGSIPDVLGAANYAIYTPGIVDLEGTRFVKLRCPELEDHRSQVIQEGYNPGIGVFKLYNTLLSHLRFDYNNFKPDLSHPIAKLSKLTFRFENLNGTLFDFKGTDHHLMISIRALHPGA